MQEKLEERQPSYRKRYRSKGKGFSLDTGNGYSFTTIQDTNELWGLPPENWNKISDHEATLYGSANISDTTQKSRQDFSINKGN